MPLVIDSLGRGHTHARIPTICTGSILRNQALWPARPWLMVNFLQDLKKHSIVNSLLITHFPSPHYAYLEVQVSLRIIVLPMFVINSTNLVKLHLMLILQAVK